MTSDLARFIDAAYARGAVLDADGDEVALAPHSIERADGEALRELARAEGARETIEVGLALGMSTLFLCQAIAGQEGARHLAIDPFQRESWNGAGLRTIRDAGVGDLVTVVEDESQLTLPRLAHVEERFDFAFVDGDHRFEGVFLDLYFLARIVRPGGLIVVDDTWMPSVRLALAYLERNLSLTLERDALPNAFRWRRRPRLRSRIPSGKGGMAVLRTPVERPAPAWDEFVSPF